MVPSRSIPQHPSKQALAPFRGDGWAPRLEKANPCAQATWSGKARAGSQSLHPSTVHNGSAL